MKKLLVVSALLLGSTATQIAMAASTDADKGVQEHSYTRSVAMTKRFGTFWTGTKTVSRNGYCEKVTHHLVKMNSMDGLQLPVIAVQERPCSE